MILTSGPTQIFLPFAQEFRRPMHQSLGALDQIENSSSRRQSFRTTYHDFPENFPLGEGYQPSCHDVICGRGKDSFNHVGNQQFRTIINANLTKYQNSVTKLDKSLVVASIVDEIRSNGGRFIRRVLVKSKLTWIDIGDKQAREKVGHTIRDLVNNHKRGRTVRRKSSTEIPSTDRTRVEQDLETVASAPNLTTSSEISESRRMNDSSLSQKLRRKSDTEIPASKFKTAEQDAETVASAPNLPTSPEFVESSRKDDVDFIRLLSLNIPPPRSDSVCSSIIEVEKDLDSAFRRLSQQEEQNRMPEPYPVTSGGRFKHFQQVQLNEQTQGLASTTEITRPLLGLSDEPDPLIENMKEIDFSGFENDPCAQPIPLKSGVSSDDMAMEESDRRFASSVEENDAKSDPLMVQILSMNLTTDSAEPIHFRPSDKSPPGQMGSISKQDLDDLNAAIWDAE